MLLDYVGRVAGPCGGLTLVLVLGEVVADGGVAEDVGNPDGLGWEVVPVEVGKSLFYGLDVDPLFGEGVAG